MFIRLLATDKTQLFLQLATAHFELVGTAGLPRIFHLRGKPSEDNFPKHESLKLKGRITIMYSKDKK